MANDDDPRIRHLVATLGGLLDGGSAENGTRDAEATRTGTAEAPDTMTPPAAETNWGKRTLVGNADDSLVVLRPRWSISRVPQLSIEPATVRGAPRREGDFLLWRDEPHNRVYFALAVPRLLDVAVLIRREQVGGTIKITGGSVTLTVSAYDRAGPRLVQVLRDRWHVALKTRKEEGKRELPRVVARGGTNGSGPVSELRTTNDSTTIDPMPHFEPLLPSYVPLVLCGLGAALEMDPALLAGAPSVAVSSDAGTITFVILLSELGGQAWMNALEGPGGSAIGGVCRITARYYGRGDATGPTVVPIELAAPLGTLLAGRGREIMQVLNAQITVEGRVIVSGHQTLDLVTVDWRPSEGHRPEALVFGPDGGSFTATITSPQVDKVKIDWLAKVSYKPINWPVITRSGQLSFARNDTILLLKPESWITTYNIFVVLLDNNGRPIQETDHAADVQNRVQCEVRFSAPFLASNTAITETFETTSQTLTELAFPLPPGESPGSVTLTVFAQLGGAAPIMKTRAIQPWETFLMVKVTPAGAIEFVVNAPEGGDSLESAFMKLASLRTETGSVALPNGPQDGQ